MKRFFSADTSSVHEEEAYHAFKVLRCKPGEQIEIITGKGQLYSAVIDTISKDKIELSDITLLKEQFSNPNKLSVAISPTKNPARFEWFLEKASEIGIDHIFPIITERTEKTTLKKERLENILLSAAKQSKQLFIPTLHPIQSLSNLLSNQHIGTSAHRFIAHCENEQQAFFGKVYSKGTQALLLIGPEGDFSPGEITTAVNNNYQAVSLGSSTLRVETAGVVACTIVNSINFER